jgi:Animal haem peroxidase
MSNSQVPRVELNKDGTINLVVDVYGIDPGASVEISGHATQENGAVATFYRVQEMPENSTAIGVKSVPVGANEFTPGFPITVVARAAEVWITTLEPDKNSGALRSRVTRSGPLKAAWKANGYGQAVFQPRQETQSAETSADTTLLRHGTWWDRRKDDSLGVVMGGRFTRLFPYLPGATFDHDELERLAREMTAPKEDDPEAGQETKPDPEENPGIPAAYTYLGQFVDHDLTFDPISHLRERLSGPQLRALVDFRTPRFDLDNLYGRGPDDQPYMYDDDGICLLPGEPMPGHPFDPGAVQLPRGPSSRGPSGRALIGDPRNDENLIVAQLHAIFLRFHNKVVRELGGKKHVSFRDVREQVRWHYQWVLVKDFLPKIVDEQTYLSVFPDPYGPVTTIPRLREYDLDLMPVEFSVGAYRFGHSMIRPRYRLNPASEHPIFSGIPGDTDDLRGFRPIPADCVIDWQFFINLGHGAGPAAGDPLSDQDARKLQLSYKIDTSLVNPLGHLPEQIARNPSCLALRNLERGLTFQLPSGQQVARALGMEPLADEELVIGKAIVQNPEPPTITDIAPGFAGNAPLWAYILSEAQVMSWKKPHPGLAQDKIPIKLGPVGGGLVAEVFASLLRGDPTSYLNAGYNFEPIAGFTRGGTFGLAELINVALRPDELDPEQAGRMEIRPAPGSFRPLRMLVPSTGPQATTIAPAGLSPHP